MSLRSRFKHIKHLIQNVPRFRRFLIGVGGAGLVILIAILSIFSYTSNVSMCQNCHEIKAAVSSWKEGAHAEVHCDACHIRPDFIGSAIDKINKIKNIYIHFALYNKKVNPPIIYMPEPKRITEENSCTKCHSVNRIYSFSGDLKVPHKLHKNYGLTCLTCHSRIVHGANVDTRLPKMELCLSCHDGRKKTKKGRLITSNCESCHTEKSAPAGHRNANWLKIHGQEAKNSYPDCKKCHEWRPDWCMQCHKQKPQSHLIEWQKEHITRAKANPNSCKSCHQQKFCDRCHNRKR